MDKIDNSTAENNCIDDQQNSNNTSNINNNVDGDGIIPLDENPSLDNNKNIKNDNNKNKKLKKEKKIKEKQKGFGGMPSAEENSNIISKACFSWADSFVWFCFKNVLQLENIWDLASYDKSDFLSKKIEESWKVEVIKPKPQYLKAAFRAFGGYFLLSWLFYGIYAATQFVGPEIISRMVTFVVLSSQGISNEDPNMGYYYSLILFGSAMIGSFCLYQSNMISARTGDRLRSIIVLDVYKKSLRLSNSSRSKTSPGEIVNLMSNDAQRMVEVFQLVNQGVFAIPQIIVSVALLYRAIGWPTFVGVGLMILAVPLNGVAAKKLTEIRRNLVSFTDARVKTTNEILQAIKIIKLYAWEDSFARKVIERRDAEIGLLFLFSRYRAMLIVIVAALPTAVSVLVFSSYYGYNHYLDAAKVFSALSYLNILRLPLGFLPIVIALAVQMQVAANRITRFLTLPEMKPVNEIQDQSRLNGIYMKNATLTWNIEKSQETFGLRSIDLEATGKTLTMVVGSVGSGKSSLLQAMLGEMDVLEGDISIKGEIAYVPQQAWIINATLKDNILFGKPYDEEKYKMVLDVCALERDIELFPQGDQIEIGERGVNLSGGQKQRVSIARAVYSDADIYILDDPLSAVDAHVGKHLFHKCFKGCLKNKTVILAANQLNYLPWATEAIYLKNGEISERGGYQQLIESQKEFSTLLKAYGVDEVTGVEHQEVDEKKEEEEIKIEEKTKPIEKPIVSNKSGSLTSQEEREEGAVAFWVYWKYCTVGGGILFALSFIFFALDTGTRTFVDWWLSHWNTVSTERMKNPNLNDLSDTQFLGIYIGIGVASIFISGARNFLFFDYTVRASRAMHHQLFNALLRAPMWFFDTTPLGRIINRFTRDLDGVDNLIATSISQFLVFFTTVLATLIIISIITPFLLVPLGPICIIFYVLQYFYRFTSRELQRLEAISRSPIFSHFSETLNGVVSIRAYKKQQDNILINHYRLDNNNKCYLTLQAMNQWLGLRLDFLANLVTFFACLFITIDRTTISGASVGLSLSYALTLTGNLNRATLQMSDTETKMNSVERISQYINGPCESLQITDIRPPESWPEHGAITFDNLIMSYREGLDPVLKGITCEIKPKEKIGIIGRTGAGKSSILVALFRLVEATEGRILLDGEDISKFGLKDLRRNLSIIPQDPVLFSGTLRENLDPFNEHSDDRVWEILEDIQLNTVVKNMEGGLDCKVTDNGENWSVGQRQLISLGRALLRKPKILVLDEATASVDSNTDSLIQKCIRDKFSDCTILTIAHRLNTIMDSDRIMVLDAGRISEFDTPWDLLQNPNGLFSWLIDETGPQNSIYLRKLAEGKHNGLNIFQITPPDSPTTSISDDPKDNLIGDIDNINSPLQNNNNNNNTNFNNNNNNSFNSFNSQQDD